jgi:ABC-type multidrug transport system fused ATPase/permease subunit
MNVLLSIWRLLDRRQRRRLVALQLLSAVMAFSTVGGVAAILPFFSVLAQPEAIDHSPLLRSFYTTLHFDNRRAFVLALGLAFVGIVLIANVVNLLGSLAMNRFAFRVGERFQVALFGEYLRRGCAFHASTNSTTLASNVLYESGRVTGGILQSGLVFVTNVITTVFIVASILFVSPRVALAAIAGLGASYALIYVGARRRLLRNGLTETYDLAERSKIVTEGFGALKEITLLRVHQFFVDAFARRSRSLSNTTASTLAISQSPRHIIEVVMVCGLVVTALRATSGSDGAGPWIAQLSFIGMAAYRLLPALQQAFASVVKIRAERSAFDGIAADLRRALAAPRVAAAAAVDEAWRGRPKREILLEAVSYHHDTDRPAAISNLTLRIPAGAVVGFVGANGSGKTTLVDLISGLLLPQSGRVLVDGVVLDDANRSRSLPMSPNRVSCSTPA